MAKSKKQKSSKNSSQHGLRSFVSSKIASWRRRAQKHEEQFNVDHPSQEIQVSQGFATRHGSSWAQRDPNKKKGFLRTIADQWWDRLLGAASEGSFAEQAEQYAAHQTKRDYILNTIGHTIWGMVFPALTIVVTQLTDAERAGMFSFAFTVGTLLMIASNYGVRTYQVSDLDEEHSFSDYQINRLVTCILMLIVGYYYCRMHGYSGAMLSIMTGVILARVVDALADVYEGRLQQMDKMYLAGVSQLVRSVLGVLVFSVVLVVSNNVGAASIALAIASVVGFVLVTYPLALLETPKSKPMSFRSIGRMFKVCFPIFLALLLYNLIDNVPKFVMEAILPYDNQLYFNALYFPAHAILLIVGMVYKPQLVRMAALWSNPENRPKFDRFIVLMLVGITVFTIASGYFMSWIGLDILGLMYGLNFKPYATACYIMLAAGGLIGAIDFLYQVITIMRRQELVTRGYLIVFGISIVSALILINEFQLAGAVISYVVVMAALLGILMWVYISERIYIAKHPEQDLALMLAPSAYSEANDSENVNAALAGYGQRVAETVATPIEEAQRNHGRHGQGGSHDGKNAL